MKILGLSLALVCLMNGLAQAQDTNEIDVKRGDIVLVKTDPTKKLLSLEGDAGIGISYPVLFIMRASLGVEALASTVGVGVEGSNHVVKEASPLYGYSGYVRLRPLNNIVAKNILGEDTGRAYIVAKSGRMYSHDLGYSRSYGGGLGFLVNDDENGYSRVEVEITKTPDFSFDKVTTRNLFILSIKGVNNLWHSKK